jgi:hypothetical protein
MADRRRALSFVRKTKQADAEGKGTLPPQPVKVLEWFPERDKNVRSRRF